MPNLSQIVDVLITRATRGVSQVGFGTPMILGSTGFGNSDVRRRYTDIDGVGVDFLTSDPEYKAALAIFSQDQFPEEIVIGKRSAKVAQVVTSTPNVSSQIVQHFIQTINGVAYDFTSDSSPTASEVVAGLSALINADSNQPVTASGSTTLILTADVSGTSFTHAESANLVAVLTTANHGVIEDMQAIQNVDDDWYMLILTSRAKDDILNAAAYIETQEKMFSACSSDSDVKTNGAGNVLAALRAKLYDRTFYLWSADQASYPEAAVDGLELPFDPGSENWKFASPKGIVADVLSATEQSVIKGNKGNTFETYSGVSIFGEGVVVSGEYIDVIRFIDWIKSRQQERIFALMVNVPKIPYTDIGASQIEGEARAVLEAGIKVGGLVEGSITFVVRKAKDQNPNDRAARYYPGITWTATLAGAINKTQVRGTISV